MLLLFAVCVVTLVDGQAVNSLTGQTSACINDVVGYVSYPGQCDKYVQCMYKQVKTCPPGLHWDPASEACNYPSVVNCTQVPAHYCDDDWFRHGSSCYRFFGSKRTWMQASQICDNHGAALAAVESSAENAFIRGYLQMFADLNADMTTWVGGNDREIEGVWKWHPSGRMFTYTDWYPGQPNPNGDCLIYWPGHNYRWGDRYCTDQQSFICEKPAEHVRGEYMRTVSAAN